jgi:putative SOS response-associated peptidase YedK
MCGRYTLSQPGDVLAEAFGLETAFGLTPRYNIAPTQEVAVVRVTSAGEKRSLALLRWGLVPAWAKDPSLGNRLINARGETVGEKPAFRNSFRRQRCLVLADGFYEWQKLAGRKQPHYFRLQDGRPFAIAGLWARWQQGEQEAIESCTLLTTEANPVVADVHGRMPVILGPEHYDAWLDPGTFRADQLQALLEPYSGTDLEAFPVSTLVNSPANDLPACVERLT